MGQTFLSYKREHTLCALVNEFCRSPTKLSCVHLACMRELVSQTYLWNCSIVTSYLFSRTQFSFNGGPLFFLPVFPLIGSDQGYYDSVLCIWIQVGLLSIELSLQQGPGRCSHLSHSANINLCTWCGPCNSIWWECSKICLVQQVSVLLCFHYWIFLF